jgi:hypothetical protein
VYTASFGTVVPGLVVPVLTTVGTPRFVRYPMVEWRTVAPYGLLGEQDLDKFRASTGIGCTGSARRSSRS